MKLKQFITSKYLLPALLLLLAALAFVCWTNRHLLNLHPFQDTVAFDGPSGVFAGESGRTYVVDNGKKEVLILDENGRYLRTIKGGSRDEGSFYYASLVTEANDGRIYVTDAVYSGEGTVISKERIVRYNADGSGGETVYTIDYDESGEYPLQYGRIRYLTVNANRLVFAVADSEKLTLYIYDTGSHSYQEKAYELPGSYIFDVTLDPETYLPAWITKLGGLYAVNKFSNIDTLAGGEGVPYQLSAAADGYIYYSDADSGALMRTDREGVHELVTDEIYAYYLDSAGRRVVGSDGVGVYSWTQEAGVEYLENAQVGNMPVRTLMWAAFLLMCLTGASIVTSLAAMLARRWKQNRTVRSVAIVLALAIIVAGAAAYFMITRSFEREEAVSAARLQDFSDRLTAAVDTDDLMEIDGLDDYRSEAFMGNKDRLNALTEVTYGDGRCYYYVIYMTDGSMIYAVMDYEDSVQSWMPYYSWEDGGDYRAVLETGEAVVVESEVSSFGAWSFILSPIKDAEGNTVAVLDVGSNLDTIMERKQNAMTETLLSIVFVTIVVVMVLVEVIFYMDQRRSRRTVPADTLETAERVPLRAIIFIAFTVDCMQDAFVSVLASSLFKGFLGLPQSVGAALPISMQVLCAALFAVVGGSMIRVLGTKKTFVAGFTVQILGFVLCAVVGNYFGLLFGKMLAGAGMGLITVSANTVAAATVDEEKSRRAFSDVTAGTLGGVSAGSGLGSIILSFGTYRIVFLVGAAVLALGLLLALSGADHRPLLTAQTGESEGVPDKKDRAGLIAFFLDRRVISFLALALLPFMMAISFREYFFPLYATEIGMTETNVGRIYVLCGLLTMYMGPVLSDLMIDKLGSRLTLIAAGVMMVAATMLFGFVPEMSSAIIGVVLLSISTSFGYVSQSTYYSSLPKVRSFGESRAMGVYSLFDNAGQTLGPVIYGMALMLGHQAGLLLIGEGLMIVTIVFTMATITITPPSGDGKKKKDRATWKTDHRGMKC